MHYILYDSFHFFLKHHDIPIYITTTESESESICLLTEQYNMNDCYRYYSHVPFYGTLSVWIWMRNIAYSWQYYKIRMEKRQN